MYKREREIIIFNIIILHHDVSLFNSFKILKLSGYLQV